MARSYISFIANAELLNGHVNEFINTASHLYKMIFKNCIVPQGRVIISPDGVYFPFEALVTDNTKPGSPDYFIQDHAVSYTYSARYLMNDFMNKENKAYGSVLGIAPVHYPYANSLYPLVGSDRSLGQVESYFKEAHNLVERMASRNNFLKQFYIPLSYKVLSQANLQYRHHWLHRFSVIKIFSWSMHKVIRGSSEKD